jgi:hypothetical protein
MVFDVFASFPCCDLVPGDDIGGMHAHLYQLVGSFEELCG